MDVEEVKTYLRVDGSDRNAEITGMMAAAAGYIYGQTGKTKRVTTVAALPVETDISDDELYQLCVKILCAHWYENRGIGIIGKYSTISISADALINHIAMCSDYV